MASADPPVASEMPAVEACDYAPPHLPDNYFKFTGKIVEAHADDDSAGAAYEEMFNRSRFEAAFPEAAGMDLPMLVGVDLEWQPDRRQWWQPFEMGSRPGNPVALVQLACWDRVLLVRTTGCEAMPPWLRECFEDNSMVKVSASFDLCDKAKLQHSFGWDFDANVKDASTFVDIADLAKERGMPHGLKKLADECKAPMLKSKEIGRSNWACEDELSPAQRLYAAEDAFFTLYLLGLIYERVPPAEGSLAAKAFVCWKLMQKAMASSLTAVDNTPYKTSFFELRDAVRDAVRSLSTAVGSDGHACFGDLFKVRAVSQALKMAQKRCSITLGTAFMRANEDLFVTFYDKEARCFKVRIRAEDGEKDEYDEDAEKESEFVSRIVEKLVSYRPPIEDRFCVLAPEMRLVPARAILSAKEQERMKNIIDRHKNWIECTLSETDGMLLRALRHPRASDAEGFLKHCATQLHNELGIDIAEAETRLKSDEKFLTYWSALPMLERGSPDEANCEGVFRARTRVLAHAHRVAERVSATWQQARDSMQSVKWYRNVLGKTVASMGKETQDFSSDLQACLDAIVEAWPNMEAVPGPGKRKGGQQGGEASAKRSKTDDVGAGKR